MSRLEAALQNDLQLLKLLRDELVLQAHLLKADMKERWEDLERKQSNLKEHLARAKVAEGDARREAETALSHLVSTMRDGYTRIRDALKS